MLVISKVADSDNRSACITGYVDALANPGANELAREIADNDTAGFSCGEDKAIYHGKRGETAADTTHVFP